MSEAPLPCPFCGGEPVKVATRDGHTFACSHGLCPGWTVRGAHLIAWNNRHPRPADLTEDERDWIDMRAEELFRDSERSRGGIRAGIGRKDFLAYFVADATVECIRVRAAIRKEGDA